MPSEEKDRMSPRRERTDAKGRPIRNQILVGIPDDEFEVLRPHLEYMPLELHRVLHTPGERIEFGFFLNSGLASLLVVTGDASVEVGMVGREGFVGAPAAMNLPNSSRRAVIQIQADAFRVKTELLERICASAPRLQRNLNRHVIVQGLQVAQLAACNRLHTIEHRLARWLLVSDDKVSLKGFPITHYSLAQMLGSGRPSITIAAGALQRAELIDYRGGTLRILDRKGLEEAACECYRAIKRINGTDIAPAHLQAMSVAPVCALG